MIQGGCEGEDNKDFMRFLNCEKMLLGKETDCATYVENIDGKYIVFG